MSRLEKFSELIEAGNVNLAIDYFQKNQRAIIEEHRRRCDVSDQGGNRDYYSTIYNDLIGGRLNHGDRSAYSVTEALIGHSILLNEVDWSGFTPLGLLANGGHIELLRLAIHHGANVNLGSNPSLTAAVFNKTPPSNWREISVALLDAGADPNGLAGAMPPLFPVIQFNQQDAIRFLVSAGADLNKNHDLESWGNFSGTALHWAVRSVHTDNTSLETISLLTELGADPIIRNRRGECVVDNIFEKEYDANDGFKPVIEFLGSRAEWKAASWKLNEEARSNFSPARATSLRAPHVPHVWEGVEFRVGDHIRVFRRYNGFYRPPEDTGHPLPVILLPGLTGTIDAFAPRGGDFWVMVVNFDPGEWEEAENFGARVQLGSVRTFCDPALVNHVRSEASARPLATRSAGTASAFASASPFQRSGTWIALTIVAAIAVAIYGFWLHDSQQAKVPKQSPPVPATSNAPPRQPTSQSGAAASPSTLMGLIKAAAAANRPGIERLLEIATTESERQIDILAKDVGRSDTFSNLNVRRDRKEARPLNERAIAAFNRSGGAQEAYDLQLQAFLSDPLDVEIAGNLAMFALRIGRVLESNDLAIYALSLPRSSGKTGRTADWSTLGASYAALDNQPKARAALYVTLAIAPDIAKRCYSAVYSVKNTYGSALKEATEAMFERINTRRLSDAPECSLPISW